MTQEVTENQEAEVIEQPQNTQEPEQVEHEGGNVEQEAEGVSKESETLPDDTVQEEEKPSFDPLVEKNKWRKKAREAETSAEELQRQLQAAEAEKALLKAALQPQEDDSLPDPDDRYDDPEGYQKRLDAYIAKQSKKTTQQMLETHQSNAATVKLQQEREARLDSRMEEHYKRAAALKSPEYKQAEDTAAEVLGDEISKGIIEYLDNSEQVMFQLGKNSAKANEFAQMFQQDSAKALIELTKYAQTLSKVEAKPSIEPDTPIEGGSGSTSSIKERIEKLRNQKVKPKDYMQQVLALRKEARAAGIDIDN